MAMCAPPELNGSNLLKVRILQHHLQDLQLGKKIVHLES